MTTRVPMTQREMAIVMKLLKNSQPDLNDQEVVVNIIMRLEILLRL